MGFDLEAKQDELVAPAEAQVTQADVAPTDGTWTVDGNAALFMTKFRALVDAMSAVGLDLSRDEFDLLRKEFLALGVTERYAVQSALATAYPHFALFQRDDYDAFVDAT